MKTEELRIGNFVNRRFWNPHPQNPDWAYSYSEIHAIKQDNVNVISVGKKEVLGNNKMDNISGILITEEWLVKLGFENTYGSRVRVRYDHFLHTETGYDFSKVADNSIEGFRYYGHYIKIHFVHQLQNLFYALTGEELTLK